MSVQTLRPSQIANLPEAERKRLYAEFVRNGIAPNGELEELQRQITAFEQIYEVSSDTMQRQIADGSRRETAEIGRWLMLIELRNRVRPHTS